MRRYLITVLSIVAAAVVVWVFWPNERRERELAEQHPETLPAPDPVPNNRGTDVGDAFRGDVHPLLAGQQPLEMAAHWSRIGIGREHLEQQVPEHIYAIFRDLTINEPRHTYTAKELSAFLPPEFGDVGQMWAIELERVAPFLNQFHANPRMRTVSRGRRAGPDGAFGMLRAVSSSHFDLIFRWHAEFQLGRNMWYTPAYFSGRMLVNRETGTIEHFRIEIPTEKTLNVHLTVLAVFDGNTPDVNREIRHGDSVVTARDIVHVERMELADGTELPSEAADWTSEIPLADAHHALKKSFYKFLEIDWVPFAEALDKAREAGKPILVAVSWGGLDDQSC